MATYRMLLEYVGTNFAGWQFQPDQMSVQQALEEGLEVLCKEKIRIIGAGRTDSGVHALGQVASFRTEASLDMGRVLRSINALTPRDIAVLDLRKTHPDFNARKHAFRRTYKYYILNREAPSAVRNGYCRHVSQKLNFGDISKAMTVLEGQHDFSSFRASSCSAKNPVRTMYECSVRDQGEGFYELTFSANGFLMRMVRAIVGTLHEIGLGKIAPEEMKAILDAKDRDAAGPSAPACGLFFTQVDYPPEWD